MGLHRRRRAAGRDVPGEPAPRFLRDRRPALAPGRQGARAGHARPAPSSCRDTAAGLSHAPSSAQLHRTAGRGHPVLRLAPPARNQRPGTDRHAGLRGIPGFPALPHRRGRHRRRRAEPFGEARGRPGRRRPGQLPGAVHRHQGPGRPAPVGRGVRLGGGRDAVGADPEQDRAGRRGGPPADARRRAAPGDGARPARCRTGPPGTPGRSRLLGQGRRAAPRRRCRR